MGELAALPKDLAVGLKPLMLHVQAGTFQRSLALVAGFSGLLGGLDVTFEHYRGSYGQKIMFSPLIISGGLLMAGVATAVRPKFARTWLPAASVALLGDGLLGFGFHIRGIHQKPGGWRLIKYSLVMGPPVFAPLLLGIGGFLGLVTAGLKPEEANEAVPADMRHVLDRSLFGATAVTSLLNGFEALTSHYKSGFKSWPQWLPVAVAPPLTVVAAQAFLRPSSARRSLPWLSGLAMATGSLGFFYHLRGVHRRPGGFKKNVLYNLTYGPPSFAPLLFAASGFMGLLASTMRE